MLLGPCPGEDSWFSPRDLTPVCVLGSLVGASTWKRASMLELVVEVHIKRASPSHASPRRPRDKGRLAGDQDLLQLRLYEVLGNEVAERTELSYNYSDSHAYMAEIEFISEEEWTKELKLLRSFG